MLSSPAYITDSWGDWKVEEMSPPSSLYPSPPPSDAIDSVPIYSFEDYNSITFSTEDPLKHEILLVDDDEIVESKAQVASKLLDDLDHLEQLDQWIKEEPLPFSDWLEEKIDLPIFGDTISSQHQISPLLPPVQVQPVILLPSDPKPYYYNDKQQDSTQSLLQEFENVFEQVTLTPPQSPQNTIFTTMQPVPMIQADVAKELAVVDELVRSRAEGLAWLDESSSSGSSVHPLSPSTSGVDSDGEWLPDTINETPRKRSKPYDRPPTEDKKSRKKEQNKNAATRYRQKKKAEIVVILSEQKGLEDINDKVKTQVNDLSREIKYLKGLMRDLFKAKGLIQ